GLQPLHDDRQRDVAAYRRPNAAEAIGGARLLELSAGGRRQTADGDLSPQPAAGAEDRRAVLRDAEPERVDRSRARAAEDGLLAPALYAGSHPLAAAVGRRERGQANALLRRVLVLRLPRRWSELGAPRGTAAGSRVVTGAQAFSAFARQGKSELRPASGIYEGTLRHRRFSPVPHEFTYPLFMVLLDVDRIGELLAVSRFTSWNRFNWATFDDRDHLGD